MSATLFSCIGAIIGMLPSATSTQAVLLAFLLFYFFTFITYADRPKKTRGLQLRVSLVEGI